MPTATINSESSIRKAAVLVRSLDGESVAALLARLSPAEARAVRQAVRELDDVSEEDFRSVAAELRAADRRGGSPAVEIALSNTPPAQVLTPAAAPVASPRLQALGQTDTASLVACLALEQPATVAVVLTCLPAGRAAEVLGQLPEDLQLNVVDRMAEMGEIDPESLEVITAELESWIAQHTRVRRRRDDRRAALQAILDASPSAARQRIAQRLAVHWPDFQPPTPPVRRAPAAEKVATEVTPPPAPRHAAESGPRHASAPPTPPSRPSAAFGRLETLTADQLRDVFAAVDHRTLLIALFGASERLTHRLRTCFTPRQMKVLEQRVRELGPLRLSDVNHAQGIVGEAMAAVLGDARRAA